MRDNIDEHSFLTSTVPSMSTKPALSTEVTLSSASTTNSEISRAPMYLAPLRSEAGVGQYGRSADGLIAFNRASVPAIFLLYEGKV
jgi:hypothetical protein